MRIECDGCGCPPAAAENRCPVRGQIADHGPRRWLSPATAIRARVTHETTGAASLPCFPDLERADAPDPLVPGNGGVYHVPLWRQSLCYSDLPECRCSREQAGDAIVPG